MHVNAGREELHNTCTHTVACSSNDAHNNALQMHTHTTNLYVYPLLDTPIATHPTSVRFFPSPRKAVPRSSVEMWPVPW